MIDEKILTEIEQRAHLIVNRQWGAINDDTMRQIEKDIPALCAALREAWKERDAATLACETLRKEGKQ